MEFEASTAAPDRFLPAHAESGLLPLSLLALLPHGRCGAPG